ncbi:MAG: transglutaminase family protein [Sporichthyaceae bacterium]
MRASGGFRRLRIVHQTRIAYAGDVLASYNEVRMTPCSGEGQTTLEAKVAVSPSAVGSRYTDYWGALVTAFDLHTPHRELTVQATSVVETTAVLAAPEAAGWEHLRTPELRDAQVEYLSTTEHTAVSAEVLAQARDLVGAAAPRQAARLCTQWLRDQVEYLPGSTGVHTRAMQAWEAKAGVCQDLAHLSVGLLRGLGIPARYVSGYLHPDPDAGIGVAVTGESHAWVQWWDGDWTSFDPTSGAPTGIDHVVVARGRDYWDVPPHKGVYAGPAGSAPEVEVEVTRLA